MVQNIIALTIVLAAVAWTVVSIVRIFRSKGSAGTGCGCGSSSCCKGKLLKK